MEGKLTSEPLGMTEGAKATLLIPTFLRYTEIYTFYLLPERSSGAWLIFILSYEVFYNFWEILQICEISNP